jgi:hypothetical protein
MRDLLLSSRSYARTICSIAMSLPRALNGPLTCLTMRARNSLPGVDDRRAVFTLQLNRHRLQSALVAISNLLEPLVQIQRTDYAALHRHVRRLVEPVILITLFSFELPFRYSTTVTSTPRPFTSWKPAAGPSVLPSPRSTRKLNCVYGRSRSVATFVLLD